MQLDSSNAKAYFRMGQGHVAVKEFEEALQVRPSSDGSPQGALRAALRSAHTSPNPEGCSDTAGSLCCAPLNFDRQVLGKAAELEPEDKGIKGEGLSCVTARIPLA